MQPSEFSLFRAGDIMTTEVVTVGLETTIQEVVDLFELHHVSGLPIVDGQNRLLGVITEYDLLQSVATLHLGGKVAEYMSADVTTVGTEASLAELAELFLSERVRRVPVVSEGILLGVISRRDLIFVGKIRQQLLTELPLVSSLAAEPQFSTAGPGGD
jgi:CBS domain-containing protein